MENKELEAKFNRQIRRAVQGIKRYNPDKIILFGSLARGDFDENSDIDLLIIKSNIKASRMIDRMRALDRYIEFGLPIEAVVFSPKEIKQRLTQNDYFLEDAIAEGEVIYEKEPNR